MKIVFTTKGTSWDAMMDPRFGRSEYLLLYDDVSNQFSHYDNRAVKNEAHGAGPQTAKKLFDLHPDVLITGNGPGGNAARVLEKAGLKVYIGAGDMNVKEAFDAYNKGDLQPYEL